MLLKIPIIFLSKSQVSFSSAIKSNDLQERRECPIYTHTYIYIYTKSIECKFDFSQKSAFKIDSFPFHAGIKYSRRAIRILFYALSYFFFFFSTSCNEFAWGNSEQSSLARIRSPRPIFTSCHSRHLVHLRYITHIATLALIPRPGLGNKV